ncbi:hypothetical protein B0H14DRAFT_2579277 [Mycena olivaceomarginata]|nr:hypothetical protein B0H14DRAFT_2579277 [Mycena olivaceomarginata]
MSAPKPRAKSRKFRAETQIKPEPRHICTVGMSTYTARKPHPYIEAVVEVELTGSEAGSEGHAQRFILVRRQQAEGEEPAIGDLKEDGFGTERHRRESSDFAFTRKAVWRVLRAWVDRSEREDVKDMNEAPSINLIYDRLGVLRWRQKERSSPPPQHSRDRPVLSDSYGIGLATWRANLKRGGSRFAVWYLIDVDRGVFPAGATVYLRGAENARRCVADSTPVLPLAYCAGDERVGTWRRIQRAPRWAGRRAERKYGRPDGAGAIAASQPVPASHGLQFCCCTQVRALCGVCCYCRRLPGLCSGRHCSGEQTPLVSFAVLKPLIPSQVDRCAMYSSKRGLETDSEIISVFEMAISEMVQYCNHWAVLSCDLPPTWTRALFGND